MAKESHVKRNRGQIKQKVLQELLNFSSENSDDELNVLSVQLQVTGQCKPTESDGRTNFYKENVQQKCKSKRKLFPSKESKGIGIYSRIPVPGSEVDEHKDTTETSSAGSLSEPKDLVLCGMPQNQNEVAKMSANEAKCCASIPGLKSSKLKVMTKTPITDAKSRFIVPAPKAGKYKKGLTKTSNTDVKFKAPIPVAEGTTHQETTREPCGDVEKKKKTAKKKIACSKFTPKVKKSDLGNMTLADLGIPIDFSESSDEGEGKPQKRNIELICQEKKQDPVHDSKKSICQEKDPKPSLGSEVKPRSEKKSARTAPNQPEVDMVNKEGGKFIKAEKQSSQSLRATTALLSGTENPADSAQHTTVQPSAGRVKKTDALLVKKSTTKTVRSASLHPKSCRNHHHAPLQHPIPNVSVIRSAHQSSRLWMDSSPSEDSPLPLSESTRLDCPESGVRPKQCFGLHLDYQNSPDLFDSKNSSFGPSQESSYEQLNIIAKENTPLMQASDVNVLDGCDDNVEGKEITEEDKPHCSVHSSKASENDSEYQTCPSSPSVGSEYEYEAVDISIQTSVQCNEDANLTSVEKKLHACSLQDAMKKSRCQDSHKPTQSAVTISDGDDLLFHRSREIGNSNQKPQELAENVKERETASHQTPPKQAENSPVFLSPFTEQAPSGEPESSPLVSSTSLQQQETRFPANSDCDGVDKALTTSDTGSSPDSFGCHRKLDLHKEDKKGSTSSCSSKKEVSELKSQVTRIDGNASKLSKPAACLPDSSPAAGNGSSTRSRNPGSHGDSSSDDDDDRLEAFFQRVRPPATPDVDKDTGIGNLSDFIVSDSDVDSGEDICYADLSRRLDSDDCVLPKATSGRTRLGTGSPYRSAANSNSSSSSSSDWQADSDDDSLDEDDRDIVDVVPATPVSKIRPAFSQSQTPREEWYTPATSVKTKPRRDKNNDKQPSASLTTGRSKADNSDVWATPAPLASRGGIKVTARSYSFLCSLSSSCPDQLRDEEARSYIKQFKKRQQELSSRLFKLFNFTVFENQLPADLPVVWNKRLLKTAGLCKQKRVGNVYTAAVELSNKVCDTAERVRDTLVHEMCHAAVWIINQAKEGHGPHWKYWARRANRAHPEIPVIRRCHDYRISTKYIYKCIKCGYQIGRHSKSLDTKKKVCGRCRGRFVLQTSSNGSVSSAGASLSTTPCTPRTPNPFALFVKENYGIVKKRHGGLPHKDVMNMLSKEFTKAKITV